MSFDAVSRTLFNASNTDLNQQIASELVKIEAEAGRIRERGGSPALELKPQVDQLRTAIEVGRFETLQQIAAIQGEARSEWEQARDKKPNVELAQIRRASNRFRGMADADVTALALAYADGSTDLSAIELNEARARLRTNGAELDVLNQVAKERRTDTPWISEDEELAKLADYGDTLSTFKADEILVESEEYGQDRFNLDNLLDLNGELAGPDTPDV
ncbi:MAG: hypothetical protein CMN78_03365 [Spirochaetales bacterium]|nr:hypothetical protein [Spirochaetales bacterium]